MMKPTKFTTYTLLVQSFYYLVTGVWPLVSINTFQMITGPKRDRWLVKTVGLLVSAIGGALALAALRRRADNTEIRLLAIGSAASLAGIDIFYAARGRISKVYLVDAVLELMLAIALLISRQNVEPARSYRSEVSTGQDASAQQ